MSKFVLFLSLLIATKMMAQSEIENLLKEADSAIGQKNNARSEPVKKVKPRKNPTKAKARETVSEKKEKDSAEIRYTSDPELAKMLDLDIGPESDSKIRTSKLMWSVGFVSLRNQSYSIEKDDDLFTAKPNQNYIGLALNINPLTLWESNKQRIESSFGISFFNPDVQLVRSGILDQTLEYTHRIVNFDFGAAYWREVYSNWDASFGLNGSVLSLMQDGNQDNDTIFDLKVGYAGHLGIHRRLMDDWSVGVMTNYRDVSMGGKNGALNGVSYTIAIEHGNRGKLF